MPNTEIQSLIQSFVTQIEAAAKRSALEQVLATLGGSMPAAKRGRGPGRPKGTTSAAPVASAVIKPVKAGKRRSAEDVQQMGMALVDYVKANPGSRGEQIAAAMGSDVGTIRLPMKALIAAKKIKTQGQRRGMKYFVAGAMPAASAAKKKSRRGIKKK
jgi:hypothetical protein